MFRRCNSSVKGSALCCSKSSHGSDKLAALCLLIFHALNVQCWWPSWRLCSTAFCIFGKPKYRVLFWGVGSRLFSSYWDRVSLWTSRTCRHRVDSDCTYNSCGIRLRDTLWSLLFSVTNEILYPWWALWTFDVSSAPSRLFPLRPVRHFRMFRKSLST